MIWLDEVAVAFLIGDDGPLLPDDLERWRRFWNHTWICRGDRSRYLDRR